MGYSAGQSRRYGGKEGAPSNILLQLTHQRCIQFKFIHCYTFHTLCENTD
jgi:hypothetical protein